MTETPTGFGNASALAANALMENEVLGALRRIESNAGFDSGHFAVSNLSSGGVVIILAVHGKSVRSRVEACREGISVKFCELLLTGKREKQKNSC